MEMLRGVGCVSWGFRGGLRTRGMNLGDTNIQMMFQALNLKLLGGITSGLNKYLLNTEWMLRARELG